MTEYSGRGDPARSLMLLWRTPGQEPSSRKARSELSTDRIVRAAIEVADAEGLAAVSMRRVADALEVGTMSLYTYVPGKAELIDVMLDSVLGEMERPEEPSAGWRARLERVVQQNWELYRRHPWLLQIATSRPVMGPNTIAKYDYELRTVADIGLTDVEMDSVLSLVLGHVEGAARRALESAQTVQQTGMSHEQWWSAHAPLLEKVFDASRHPTAARVGAAAGAAYGAAHDPEHELEFGLQRILDGIEVLIERRATKRKRKK